MQCFSSEKGNKIKISLIKPNKMFLYLILRLLIKKADNLGIK